jgi:cathepsin D
VGDSQSVAKLYKAIPGAKSANNLGQGIFTIPCNSIPTVSLSFAGTSFAIDPQFFNLGAVQEGSSKCVGGIMAGDIPDNNWVVGDVFLQNVVAAFDVGNSQVGFAKQ